MAKVLIVGASRGIGLELAKQLAAAGNEVIAGARDPDGATLLADAAKEHENITVEQVDVADPASVEAAGKRLSGAIDDVYVVAGATGGMKQTLDDIDLEEWHRTFDVNTIGPFLVARAFKPHLAASGHGKLMIVSSQLAASTWPFGGFYVYGTTKAAVNKVGQILALDWKDEPITVALMHPGYVQTDMGGPNAEITPEESASGIRSVMAGLTKADSGKFYKWNGDIHPW